MWEGTLLYFILINSVAFILFGIDKGKARKGSWRIPERTLIGISLFGGALGALFGMLFWHHKTGKWKFLILIPLCLAGWIMFIIYIVTYR